VASVAQKSQFTVIRYDPRAHGQSNLPRAPFSHVNDLFDVLDELHIDKVALIGLSAGSTIALDAALQSPAAASGTIRVGRVTCAGAAPPGGLPYSSQAR